MNPVMENDAVEKTLFVGQVPFHCTADDVLGWITPYAIPRDCRLKPGTKSHCAFVKFEKFSQAEAVIQALDGWTPVEGALPINVSFSKVGKIREGDEIVADRKLFIGQVPKEVTEADLMAIFQPFGTVTHLHIHRTNGNANNCAFLKYNTWLECEQAIEGLHQQVVLPGASSPISVSLAASRFGRQQATSGKRALEETLLTMTKRTAMPALPAWRPAPPAELPPGCDEWKLFVGQLPLDTTEAELQAYFSLYGDVLSVRVLRDPVTLKPKHCAFVQYRDASSAETAISSLDQKAQLRGKRMTVKFANAPPSEADLAAPKKGGGALRGQPPAEAGGAHPGHVAALLQAQQSIGGIPVPRGGDDVPHKLFVGQIPQEYGEQELVTFFNNFGTVLHLNLLRDHATFKSKCCCFVVFSTPAEAHYALQSLNGTVPPGSTRALSVSYAKARG
eukprot:EG_transcript_11379